MNIYNNHNNIKGPVFILGTALRPVEQPDTGVLVSGGYHG